MLFPAHLAVVHVILLFNKCIEASEYNELRTKWSKLDRTAVRYFLTDTSGEGNLRTDFSSEQQSNGNALLDESINYEKYPHANLREYQAVISVKDEVAPLGHFWESTGFCPPDPHNKACDWLLSEDMKQNLIYIGSVPHSGIKNVRVHYLLDAVFVSRFVGGHPVYNFTCLDVFIQRLHENGLKPGFELMGNPSDFFTDFENRTQVFLWRDLVHQLANRYMEEYGLGYVSQWNFESWNEPKPRTFDGLNFTYQGFFNYYDACSEGLTLASDRLLLGAPSGGCKEEFRLGNFCWQLLNHIEHGTNFFTGDRGTRTDYISIHKKGQGPNNSQVLMDKEEQFEDLLKKHLPGLVDIPIINDEADPLVGWNKILQWRADSTYAGMIAKVIYQHQRFYFTENKTSVRFRMLSNDNGFMSYQPEPFSQRTLLARFQVNHTLLPHVQFVRKPSHGIMGLLSLLGDTEVKTMPLTEAYGEAIGVLASVHRKDRALYQDSWQMAALVYYSVDTHSIEHTKFPAVVNINLTFEHIKPNRGMKYVVYLLDDNHGNPSKVWKNAKSPRTPSHSVFADMRANQDPVRVLGPADVDLSSQGHLKVTHPLSLPGVALIHVCAATEKSPDQVNGLALYNITYNQVLISWSDSCINSRCLFRYNVEYSMTGKQGSFVKINPHDSIFTVFVYAPISNDSHQNSVRGYYRVQAVDYWLRAGDYSLVQKY